MERAQLRAEMNRQQTEMQQLRDMLQQQQLQHQRDLQEVSAGVAPLIQPPTGRMGPPLVAPLASPSMPQVVHIGDGQGQIATDPGWTQLPTNATLADQLRASQQHAMDQMRAFQAAPIPQDSATNEFN